MQDTSYCNVLIVFTKLQVSPVFDLCLNHGNFSHRCAPPAHIQCTCPSCLCQTSHNRHICCALSSEMGVTLDSGLPFDSDLLCRALNFRSSCRQQDVAWAQEHATLILDCDVVLLQPAARLSSGGRALIFCSSCPQPDVAWAQEHAPLTLDCGVVVMQPTQRPSAAQDAPAAGLPVLSGRPPQ